MPQVTKDWVAALSTADLHKALSLGLYYKRAELLFLHTDEWFWICTDGERSEKDRAEAFNLFFIHYYMIWVSLVYVVHEGFLELCIEDNKLKRLAEHLDMNLLKRFRNATFHYQPHLRSNKHSEYIEKNGFGAARELFERQGVLIRRIAKLAKWNPHIKD